jgi:tRNA pseudouridine65 synthase
MDQIEHANDHALEILAQGSDWLAVNKPAGVAVHPSHFSGQFKGTVVQRLRQQLKQPVHAVHRLDSATSGVLLMALDAKSAARLSLFFSQRLVDKRYLAIARGWPSAQTIDHALTSSKGKKQSARTELRPLARITEPWVSGRFESQRYSLLELKPLEGRQHQIRKHLKHVSHPIVGDVRYGKGEHNRLARSHRKLQHLALHAWQLTLPSESGVSPLCALVPESWRAWLADFTWEAPELAKLLG